MKQKEYGLQPEGYRIYFSKGKSNRWTENPLAAQKWSDLEKKVLIGISDCPESLRKGIMIEKIPVRKDVLGSFVSAAKNAYSSLCEGESVIFEIYPESSIFTNFVSYLLEHRLIRSSSLLDKVADSAGSPRDDYIPRSHYYSMYAWEE